MTRSGLLDDFGAFYERAYPAAFRVALGMVGDRGLAEDVTQDAFATAYGQRERFRGDGPPEAWLHRILFNAAIAVLRRRRVRQVVPLEPAVDTLAGPVDLASATVRHVDLAGGLGQLDPRARCAVILRYYLDYDYGTIGSIIGTSTSNVGTILSRSLDRLRELLDRPAQAAGSVAFAGEVRRHG